VSTPRFTASNLDLRPLYYFVRVAEEGSFSRAAAVLSVGQPVLSRFIKQLEESLKVQLLHRTGRGVRLTDAGERLFQHAELILRTLSQAHTEATALGDTPLGQVSVVLPPLLGGIVSADLVRRLRAEYPLITLSLREGFAAEAMECLGSGRVDIGILYNPPPVVTLVTQHVLDDQVHLAGTPGSLDRPGGDPVSLRQMEGLPLVLPPPPHRLRALIDDAAHQAHATLTIEVQVEGTSTILELVRKRVGYTVLPSALLHDEIAEGRLQSWPIAEPAISTRLFITTSMQRPQTLATKAVLKIIGELFSSYRRSAR
jgi:LysR family transcriptional regulator, nitrogen assimilation regulatory protein